MSHDPRCEHSKTKRCRCDCHGAQHGIHAGEVGTYADECDPGVIRDESSPAFQQALDQIEAAGRTIPLVKAAYARHFGGVV